MEPLPRGGKFEFANEIFGGSIPKNFIPAVEKGIVETAANGYLAGFPMVDFKVTVYDGSYHDVDSSELAFKLAARKAFKAAMQQAKPALLEPVMNVEMQAPVEYAGDLMGDLNGRRGRISGMDTKGSTQIIRAQVPMSRDAELSERSDFHDAGPRVLHDGVRSLRLRPAAAGGQDHRRGQGRQDRRRRGRRVAPVPRIVSLIASATEIVDALGEFGNLVGRSHECDFPEAVARLPVCTRPAIPVSGDSREIDRLVKDRLREAVSVYRGLPGCSGALAAHPHHHADAVRSLRRQPEGCRSGVGGEDSLRARKLVPLHPNCLADVWDDIRRVARALDIAGRGETAIDELKARMSAISRRALAQSHRPTVACIEWFEPLMAAGNWVPELVEMAGGVNLFGEAGKHSPWMSWEQLVEADPEVIVVMPCGWDKARTEPEMHWLTDRPEWPSLRAVRNRRVHLTDGNQYFNRPGPRLVESLDILAAILHPI